MIEVFCAGGTQGQGSRCLSDQAVIMDRLSGLNNEEGQNRILPEWQEKVFAGKILKARRWDMRQSRLVLRELWSG